MKISNLVFIVGLVALSGAVLAQDEADTVALKDYFNSREGLSSEERGEKLRDFIVTPDNPKFSETTDYTLEFSVSSKTFFKIVDGYLVFYFPEGFGLSELDAASIRTDFGFIFLAASEPKTEGRFVILKYLAIISDTLWDSTVVPERVNFDIRLHQIVNPSRTKNYKIAGAAITDHRFVAGPTWSESFEITEESQETKAKLQIVSTELVAPNSPKVNTNQEVAVEVLVANVGNKTAHNVSVGLVSDGESSINTPQTIEMVEPNDTVSVSFEVTAAAESGTENFTSDIVSGNVIEIEPVDDTAGVVIQPPVSLRLISKVHDGDTIQLLPGSDYQLGFGLGRSGPPNAGSGQFRLTTGGLDFGIDTIVLGEIIPNRPLSFDLSIPYTDTTAIIRFELLELPIDSNTGEAALIDDTSIEFGLAIEFDFVGLLRVEAYAPDSVPMERGVKQSIFDLSLTNLSNSILGPISIDSILVLISGYEIRLDDLSFIDLDNSGFWDGEEFVSAVFDSGRGLYNGFENFNVVPNETKNIDFQLTLKELPVFDLVVQFNVVHVKAHFISGPNAGKQPRLQTSTFFVSVLLDLPAGDHDFDTEILVENNPFNPNDGPVSIVYLLDGPSAVEFRIFSVTGELVLSSSYPAGGRSGGREGRNQIYWDGKNEAGEMVLNGVYVATIEIQSTGEKRSTRIAVLK